MSPTSSPSNFGVATTREQERSDNGMDEWNRGIAICRIAVPWRPRIRWLVRARRLQEQRGLVHLQPTRFLTLEELPPGSLVSCPDLVKFVATSGVYVLADPELQLHCDRCNGTRFFQATIRFGQVRDTFENGFLVYHCRNCRTTSKTFALTAVQKRSDEPMLATQATRGYVYKIGEIPAFGPPVPAKAITLVGPDSELFLKGRNAENQGLGIGAFAYYRRVVENQKNRILDEIIRVAQKTRAGNDVVRQLRAAREETQFTKAIDIVKDCIPPVLLIDGHHNPLVLCIVH